MDDRRGQRALLMLGASSGNGAAGVDGLEASDPWGWVPWPGRLYDTKLAYSSVASHHSAYHATRRSVDA